MKKLATSLLKLTAISALLVPALASAHATFLEKTFTAGQTADLVLQVGHGCKNAADPSDTKLYPTRGVIITMPAVTQDEATAGTAVTGVQHIFSWYDTRVKTNPNQLNVPDHSGNPVPTDMIDAIAVTGFNLPYHDLLLIPFRVKLPANPAAEGQVIKFEAIQYCEGGLMNEWTDASGAGRTPTITVNP